MIAERAAKRKSVRRRTKLDFIQFLLVLASSIKIAHSSTTSPVEGPIFSEPISNVTVPVGREAVLACVVENLSNYKVAWLRVTTQTILTIANHVITKNHRIMVSQSDHKRWHLHIRDVQESDQGTYMCQINTDPMISQVGLLEVVIPPDILDYQTSTDMVVTEGNNVTLRCAAKGSPIPNITWRREDGSSIRLGNGSEVSSVEGSLFNITRVNRRHMGAYLCIASNGVPPTVSKRIMLIVHFSPNIEVPNQLVGVQEGQQMTLECFSEAFPKSINYWTRDDNNNLIANEKYKPALVDNVYKIQMKLTIKNVTSSDFGNYKCISRNSLGSTDGTIKLYSIPIPTTEPTTTTQATTAMVMPSTTSFSKSRKKHKPRQRSTSSPIQNYNEFIKITKNSSKITTGVQRRNNDKLQESRTFAKTDPVTMVGTNTRINQGTLEVPKTDKTSQSMSTSNAASLLQNSLNGIVSNFVVFIFMFNLLHL